MSNNKITKVSNIALWLQNAQASIQSAEFVFYHFPKNKYKICIDLHFAFELIIKAILLENNKFDDREDRYHNLEELSIKLQCVSPDLAKALNDVFWLNDYQGGKRYEIKENIDFNKKYFSALKACNKLLNSFGTEYLNYIWEQKYILDADGFSLHRNDDVEICAYYTEFFSCYEPFEASCKLRFRNPALSNDITFSHQRIKEVLINNHHTQLDKEHRLFIMTEIKKGITPEIYEDMYHINFSGCNFYLNSKELESMCLCIDSFALKYEEAERIYNHKVNNVKHKIA